MELNEEQEGILYDYCVNIWETLSKKQSVRFHAFKTLVETARKYPELSTEITALADEQYTETLTPGVKASITRMAELISR